MKIKFLNSLYYHNWELQEAPYEFHPIPIFPRHFVKEIEEGESYNVSFIGYKKVIVGYDIQPIGENLIDAIISYRRPIYKLWRVSVYFLWFGVKIEVFR